MFKTMDDNNSSSNLPPALSVDICLSFLEEALHQLFILKRLRNGSKGENVDDCPRTTITKKNMGKTNNEGKTRIKCNLEKFEKSLDFVDKTLQTTFEELKSKGTHEGLMEVIKTLKQTKQEEAGLKEETKKKKIELKKLECTLFEEKLFYHRKIAECMADIGKVKDEIEDFLVESEIKLEYIEKWQNSKVEMNEILLQTQEGGKMSQLKKLDRDLYKENRVHHEVVTAYKEMEKDIQCEKDKWEQKYNKDFKELEEKIQVLQNKRKKQYDAKIALKEQYAKRQREINDFKNYKIKMEEKRLVLQKQNEAATKIQAWWRGTMVRKGLGRFKKKKDKKGKKKGADKPVQK